MQTKGLTVTQRTHWFTLLIAARICSALDPPLLLLLLLLLLLQVLLIRRAKEPAKGQWCFPGGSLELGAAAAAAAAEAAAFAAAAAAAAASVAVGTWKQQHLSE
jgi:8-oxo-dGTP pyrophosphatase MutT (NUDIX family)